MEQEIKEFKNELGELYYRCTVSDKYVYQDWYGDFLTLEDVIEGSTWGLDMCEKYHFKVMVNNNSKLNGSWDHANDWISNVWLPRALSLGLTKLSHVVSPDVFTTSSAEEMRQNVEGKLEMRFFPDVASAEAWVLE
jgi:hypothetical protein